MDRSRRRFFKNVGGFAAGITFFELATIYFGAERTLFKKAFADSAPVKRYINFHADGAPPRWAFDQWLTPNLTDAPLTSSNVTTWNPGFATAFDSSGNYLYKTTTYRGIQVPHHFDVPVTLSSGSTPLSNLLDNMAVVRGYNSLTDGHEVNGPLQLYPDPAAPTLGGLAADARADRVAGLVTNLNSNHPFFSAKGKTALFVSDHGTASGSIYGLMKAFQKVAKNSTGLTSLDQVSDVITTFEDATRAHLRDNNLRSGAMVDHLRATKDLSLLAVSGLLSSNWTTLSAKYTAAMNSAVRLPNTITGITDVAIMIPTAEQNPFSNGGMIDSTYDLRQMVSGANASTNFMRSFVLAEYCLKNDICGSLCLGSGENISNLALPTSTTSINSQTGLPQTTTDTTTKNSQNDQHIMPFRAKVILGVAYWRAFGAGMLELVNALKGTPTATGTLFDETLIHVTADFARAPRYSQAQFTANNVYNYSGSDHGWQGQTTTLISGAIQRPMIVGNITAAHNVTSMYQGLWGFGAAVDFNGSKEILSPRHVAAIVANVLGTDNPWTSTHLAMKLVNGKLEPQIGASNV